MSAPAPLAAMEATWPPFGLARAGPWTIREGRGGGQRVSAASVAGAWVPGDIGLAEAAMRGLRQAPIFLVTGDESLDAALDAAGYRRHDPVVLMDASCTDIRGDAAGVTALWPPCDDALSLWDAGGIGPARRAVMARVAGGKAALLARDGAGAAGVAFVALDGCWAVLHALEVAPACRRRGVGARIVAAAAGWASARGAARLALAVTVANAPARALYARLGMRDAGGYHYRVRP